MFGAVEVIPINNMISFEDVHRHPQSSCYLRAGKVIKVCFHLNKHSSAITYDIDGGFKKYVNVEDCSSLISTKRQNLFYDTMFEIGNVVQIEIAGVKRHAEVDSIEVKWIGNPCIVSYGVRDRTETVYYGISEKELKKWNSVEL
ncbi:hypothetical protein [Rossellomorea aquimaris]|uniref:Uncharacterized protein n=1 Tax=Rossellomorea aquimaris TaxID=189382 RepID=A0A1J6WUU5_9BACI|nr:hypothetical protein [Rossellomorea aquimaris]OIU71995.1 hypothetical protein BHE18_04965 [Rossellomorea aquimaris]